MNIRQIKQAIAPLFIFCEDSYEVSIKKDIIEISCNLFSIPEDLDQPIVRRGWRQSIRDQIFPFVINNIVKEQYKKSKDIKVIKLVDRVIIQIPKRLIK